LSWEIQQVFETADKFIVGGTFCAIFVCRIKNREDVVVRIGLVAELI
jgi:hypothetical protein